MADAFSTNSAGEARKFGKKTNYSEEGKKVDGVGWGDGQAGVVKKTYGYAIIKTTGKKKKNYHGKEGTVRCQRVLASLRGRVCLEGILTNMDVEKKTFGDGGRRAKISPLTLEPRKVN